MSSHLWKVTVVPRPVRVGVTTLNHLHFHGTPLLSVLRRRVVRRDVTIRLIDGLLLKLILTLILGLMLILGLKSLLNLILGRVMIVSLNSSVSDPPS